MATTTASLTITSADLVGDALSLSSSKVLHKAGTTVGLDQTTGMARLYFMWMPWSQIAQKADIEIAPSAGAAAAGITVDYTCIHQGITYPTSGD